MAHVAHVAVDDEEHDCGGGAGVFNHLVLAEVAGKGGGGHDEHDDVLHHGDGVACPEGVGVDSVEREVALQHVDGVLLEGEDGGIVEHAKKGYEPEAAARKNLSQIFELEGVVFLLSLAGLGVEFAVHEEVDDKHDEGNHEEHHTKGYGA